MSFPADGRDLTGVWIVRDDAERDAIGSTDGLRAGDRAWNRSTSAWDVVAEVLGPDASSWVPGAAAGTVRTYLLANAGELTIATDVTPVHARVSHDGDVVEVTAEVKVPPIGGQVTANVEVSKVGDPTPQWNPVASVTIDDASYVGVHTLNPPIAVKKNSFWRLNVSAVGSTTSGEALAVSIEVMDDNPGGS